MIDGSLRRDCAYRRADRDRARCSRTHLPPANPGRLIAASVEAGMLVTVLDNFDLATRPVSLVYAAGRFLPIKVRAFLDFAAPRLKAQLTRDGAGRPT